MTEMKITEAQKMAMFKKVLEMETLAERPNYGVHNYAEQSDGAFQMLGILGLGKEYIEWAYKKEVDSFGNVVEVK
jgi:hypothetical protein